MYQLLQQRLFLLSAPEFQEGLATSKIGLEKESLRVLPEGGISQTPHPQKLGSALTSPLITTDFSEALIELITPPCDSVAEVIQSLDEIQNFVYRNLDNEILWATTRVFLEAEGVGFSRSISMQSLFPLISTVIAMGGCSFSLAACRQRGFVMGGVGEENGEETGFSESLQFILTSFAEGPKSSGQFRSCSRHSRRPNQNPNRCKNRCNFRQ